MKLGNWNFSNTYYPRKGQFESTKKYLEYVKEIICTKDSCNEKFPK